MTGIMRERGKASIAAELLEIGGDELVNFAWVDANWYADLFYPWTGEGDEPTDRLYARLHILTQRLDRARREARDSM